jgi:hypothetical protein
MLSSTEGNEWCSFYSWTNTANLRNREVRIGAQRRVSVLDTTLNKWIFGESRVHVVGHITAVLSGSSHAAPSSPDMKAGTLPQIMLLTSCYVLLKSVFINQSIIRRSALGAQSIWWLNYDKGVRETAVWLSTEARDSDQTKLFRQGKSGRCTQEIRTCFFRRIEEAKRNRYDFELFQLSLQTKYATRRFESTLLSSSGEAEKRTSQNIRSPGQQLNKVFPRYSAANLKLYVIGLQFHYFAGTWKVNRSRETTKCQTPEEIAWPVLKNITKKFCLKG